MCVCVCAGIESALCQSEVCVCAGIVCAFSHSDICVRVCVCVLL